MTRHPLSSEFLLLQLRAQVALTLALPVVRPIGIEVYASLFLEARQLA